MPRVSEACLEDCKAFVFMMRSVHGPNSFEFSELEREAAVIAKLLYPDGTKQEPREMIPHGPGSE